MRSRCLRSLTFTPACRSRTGRPRRSPRWYLGLVNTLVKPILVLLTLPVTILTLGLFLLVINALLFWGVAQLVEGFQVSGFWAALLGAMLYSVIGWLLSKLIPDRT